jgi:hypothetical protein
MYNTVSGSKERDKKRVFGNKVTTRMYARERDSERVTGKRR